HDRRRREGDLGDPAPGAARGPVRPRGRGGRAVAVEGGDEGMNQIGAFALNTFREAMRNKLLYLILIFACLLILSAWAIGQLSLHEETRVAKDLGLAGISFFGVVLSIVGGVNLVYQE